MWMPLTRRALVAALMSVLLLGTFGMTMTASATPLTSPIAAAPELPANQQAGVAGYFDLAVQPGAKQTVFIRITNLTDAPVPLQVAAVNGLTAVNGGTQYVSGTGTAVAQLLDTQYALSRHLTVPSTVQLAPHATQRLPVTIQVPVDGQGTYLGGVRLTTPATSGSATPAGAGGVGFTIRNRVQLVIGIQLNLPSPATPALTIGDVGLSVVPAGARIAINLRNPSASLLGGVSGTYRVTQGQTKVLTGSFGPFKMAPMTSIQYPVPWAGTPVPGTYQVTITGTFAQGTSIQAERSFTIGQAAIEHYQSVTGKPASAAIVHPASASSGVLPWWGWLIVAVAMVLVGAGTFLVGRRTHHFR